MRRCLICRKQFATPARFADHCVRVHHVSRAKIERVLQEHAFEAQLCLVAVGNRPMVMVTPSLL
jgi:phosphoribosyl-dephospho-CoA transferase